jgi:hypothetical protein
MKRRDFLKVTGGAAVGGAALAGLFDALVNASGDIKGSGVFFVAYFANKDSRPLYSFFVHR